MASANPPNMSGKIDNTMNLFRQNIDEKKAEVNLIREEMKQLIDKKSDELLRELEAIWKEVKEKEKKKGELDQDMREIKELQKAMEDLFRKRDPSFTQITEVSERIETVKKEIDIETPVVKLSWKVGALRDSISSMCSCKVQDKSDSPVTPKSDPCHGKMEGDYEKSKARQERVVAYFVVNNKDVTVHGTIMTKFSDKSDQVYYELFTDTPVHFQIRDKEIYLKAKRKVKHDNSLFVRTDQCVLDHPGHQDPL